VTTSFSTTELVAHTNPDAVDIVGSARRAGETLAFVGRSDISMFIIPESAPGSFTSHDLQCPEGAFFTAAFGPSGSLLVAHADTTSPTLKIGSVSDEDLGTFTIDDIPEAVTLEPDQVAGAPRWSGDQLVAIGTPLQSQDGIRILWLGSEGSIRLADRIADASPGATVEEVVARPIRPLDAGGGEIDVTWTERHDPDGADPFDVLWYNRLECHPL
jgi:hypothetical protein